MGNLLAFGAVGGQPGLLIGLQGLGLDGVMVGQLEPRS